MLYFQIHLKYMYFITSDTTARVSGAIYWLCAGHPKLTLAECKMWEKISVGEFMKLMLINWLMCVSE